MKRVLLLLSVVLITALHYYTAQDKIIYHDIYRRLYYVPIVVGAFLFGLRGSLVLSGGVTVLYLPYVVLKWRGGESGSVEALLEIVLFNGIAYIAGWLVDRERRERQRAMEYERLASFGGMAASMVHEIKNPLVSIGGFAHVLNRSRDIRPEDHKAIEVIIQEVDRLEKLVGEVMDLARPGMRQVESVDLNILLDRCMDLCRKHDRCEGIEFRRSVPEDVPLIRGDGNRLEQVFLNLILNAVSAMPQGGRLRLDAEIRDDAVYVEIEDTGNGIPVDQMEKIFIPFFTTKPQGSGLGLPICKRIVLDHGGRMAVRSEVGVGTTFVVELPRYQKEATG